MLPIVIEVHLLDLPEVSSAIAAAVAQGIRDGKQPALDEWMSRADYAELVGLSVRTLYNEPWRCPPVAPGSALHCW